MNFDQTDEFQKELKKFKKKWRSLPADLAAAEKIITDLYIGQKDNENLAEYRASFFNNKRAAIISPAKDGKEVIKMRLDCESLGNKDILRLIFICVINNKSVTFIELYAKNQKSREDTKRIKHYLD